MNPLKRYSNKQEDDIFKVLRSFSVENKKDLQIF